jgi:hypothetical protein
MKVINIIFIAAMATTSINAHFCNRENIEGQYTRHLITLEIKKSIKQFVKKNIYHESIEECENRTAAMIEYLEATLEKNKE